MQRSLDGRVRILESAVREDEGMMPLVFANGETIQVSKDFFKKFFAEKRPPGSMALPITRRD